MWIVCQETNGNKNHSVSIKEFLVWVVEWKGIKISVGDSVNGL